MSSCDVRAVQTHLDLDLVCALSPFYRAWSNDPRQARGRGLDANGVLIVLSFELCDDCRHDCLQCPDLNLVQYGKGRIGQKADAGAGGTNTDRYMSGPSFRRSDKGGGRGWRGLQSIQ